MTEFVRTLATYEISPRMAEKLARCEAIAAAQKSPGRFGALTEDDWMILIHRLNALPWAARRPYEDHLNA